MEQKMSQKVINLTQKAIMSDMLNGQSVKQYNPATYPVKLSKEYKSTISLLKSSLDFVIHTKPDLGYNENFKMDDFSEDPKSYLELISNSQDSVKNEYFTRYYVFTKKLNKYFEEQTPDTEGNITIPITGEEYMLAKSIMLTNLISMQSLADNKELAAKNPNYAKTLANYSELVDAFLQDKDVEIASDDMLIISYSLYYSIVKQWQHQADAAHNYKFVNTEEALQGFKKEDIDKFIQSLSNQNLS